jgi:hypothetical protein
MKRIYLFCILFVSISASAQNEWFHYAEEFYFVKEMPVKAIRGKNFRYEIAVKSNRVTPFQKCVFMVLRRQGSG